MSRSSVAVLLRHMGDAANEAYGYVREIDREALDGNRLLQHGLVRCIEVIGEAASRLDADYRTDHPELPWQKIIGMRNRLVHAYFDIDLDVVWSTSKNELPNLIAMVETLLAEWEDE